MRKLLLVLSVVLCLSFTIEAVPLPRAGANNYAEVEKLDHVGVKANMRNGRQDYNEEDSAEDSDEDDDEDDAELQHRDAIRRQQAYEQSVYDSQEGSDEDNEDNFEEDNDSYFGRRIRRETESINKAEEHPKPSESTDAVSTTISPTVSNSGAPNTSVLILIRDAIKKVTELPNTQQVATSAQQYFQLFEHFIQQTIEQVIGPDDDDDDEDEIEIESYTNVPQGEKESVTEVIESGNNDNSEKMPGNETSADKETSTEHETLQLEENTEETNEIKA